MVLAAFWGSSQPAVAETENASAPAPSPWIASGGFGLTFNPGMALFAPQLEYHSGPDTLMGPLVQVGLGNPTLFTANWGVRYVPPTRKKLKPTIQGALGLAIGAGFPNGWPVAPHLLLGFGFDYQLDKRLSFGTMLNVDFAPPLQSIYVSWPLLVGRFVL
jgi:hypothetical protein